MTDTYRQGLASPALLHATCVACHVHGRWLGVLLRGASETGKSDLALRLIMDKGWNLVADDYTCLIERDRALWASCPETLRHKIEIRGYGVMDMPARCLDHTPLHLCVDLVTTPAAVPRMPEPRLFTWKEHTLPCLTLWAFAASAPAVLQAVMESDTFANTV